MAATTASNHPSPTPGVVVIDARDPRRGAPLVAGGVVCAGLAALAVVVALSSSSAGPHVPVAVSGALLIAAPVAAGLYALSRDPGNRFASLLVAAGFLWAPTMLAASQNPTLYSVGRVAGWIAELLLVFLILAFPTGGLTGRVERALFGATVAVVVLLYLPAALLQTAYPAPTPWSACRHDCPPNALALVDRTPGFVHSVVEPVREYATVAVWLLATVLLAVRVARAAPPRRRTLLPVVLAAAVALLAHGAFIVTRRVDRWSEATTVLGTIGLLAIAGLALAFLLGLVQIRVAATLALARLTRRFDRVARGGAVRGLLADAIRDPTLDIAYWAGDPGGWVSEAGLPVTLPSDDPTRTITEIDVDGRPVAALVHEPGAADDHVVHEAVGGFALMALENRRLDAELHASLRELAESRARILSAVDFERRRVERDLHDGAQQRLVALRVSIEVAREALERDPAAAAPLMDRIATEIDATLQEIRALARGVYPPLLADHGVGEALRAAADAGPLSAAVTSDVPRYSQQIESTVYFVCLEALQNAAKHSGAQHVTVRLWEEGGEVLRFEVRDDGHGFAQRATGGTGLSNMRDRIAAVGGRLTVDSAPGAGTRVAGEVPVGLAQLTPDAAMLFQRATDALDDGFAIYRAVRDSSGAIVDFAVEHLNDAAARDTGRRREAQVGRTLGSLDPGYRRSERFAWHCQALAAETPSSLEETVYTRRDGTRRLQQAFEVRAVPLGGGRLAVTWRAITERKRREGELLLQSTALDRAAEGLCVIRAADGVIVYANARFERIYGYDPGELEGRHVSVLNAGSGGEADRRAREIVSELARRGEATFEVLNRRKDGSEIWSEGHTVSFDHPDHGRVWVSVQQDITERKVRAGGAGTG